MTDPLGRTGQHATGTHVDAGCCGQPGPPPAAFAPRPGDVLTLTPSNASVPIACTLSGSEQGERIAQWHRLLTGARREGIPGGLRWRLPTAQAGEVAALAAAEQRCCAFFDFTLRLNAGELWLEARAPAEASALFAEVFGSPAGTGTSST